MKMFSSSSKRVQTTNMTFGLKIDTQSPGWDKTIIKVLKQIDGVNYVIDAEVGMAYITGKADPNTILRRLAKAGTHTELCRVETRDMQNSPMEMPSYSGNNGYHYPQPNHGYSYPYPGYGDNGGGYSYPYHQQGYHNIPDQYTPRLSYPGYGHQNYPNYY